MVVRLRGDGDGWLVGVLERLEEEFALKAEQKGMISNNKTKRTNHPPPSSFVQSRSWKRMKVKRDEEIAP
jgi:hypothetical protein